MTQIDSQEAINTLSNLKASKETELAAIDLAIKVINKEVEPQLAALETANATIEAMQNNVKSVAEFYAEKFNPQA